jgi:2-phosphosulfolactate phosphatase
VKTVCIDCLPDSAAKYGKRGFAVIAVDVIRATTTLVTAIALGRRCFAVASLDDAYLLAERLPNPLLMGEVAGEMPALFDMNNSPAKLAERADVDRPVIVLSSSGTKLIHNAQVAPAVYIACLRNYAAVASYVAANHERVAVIGAGSREEFREEDQLCCARIAARILRSGHTPGDEGTARLIQRWRKLPLTSFLVSNSVEYLKNTNQLDDLHFILSNINDVKSVCTVDNSEIVAVGDELLSVR